MPQNLLPFGGEMLLFENCFTKEESDYYYDTLLHEIPWKLDKIVVFGKTYDQPRLTALYGDAGTHYAYSGIEMPATLWTDTLKRIKEKVETVTGTTYNIALLNLYRNGSDKVGWHRDNEKGMGIHPTIASVSLGATRKFQIKKFKEEKGKLLTFNLEHGSVLLMKGDMQNVWSHQVPKTSKPVDARINITFRKIIK